MVPAEIPSYSGSLPIVHIAYDSAVFRASACLVNQARAARFGWNGSPIPTASVSAELWPLIEDEDWCQSSETMPNFPESSLSDEEAKDLYAYVRTFKDNAPPLEEIPTLNAIVESAGRPYQP